MSSPVPFYTKDHDPLDDIYGLFRRASAGPSGAGQLSRLGLAGGFAGGLPDYSQLGDIPEAPMATPPAPEPTPTRIPVDDPGIPSFRADASLEDIAADYMREQSAPPFRMEGVRRPTPDAGSGRVAVTIGGKTYDYGAGERIPLLHRGGYGGGNLAANQPGGVIPGREPSQISPSGMAEEARRGGTGVSMMETDEVLPSQLESAAGRATLAELERKASDPYGLERRRVESQIKSDEDIRRERAKQQAILDRQMSGAESTASTLRQIEEDGAALLRDLRSSPEYQRADAAARQVLEAKATTKIADLKRAYMQGLGIASGQTPSALFESPEAELMR